MAFYICGLPCQISKENCNDDHLSFRTVLLW
uniref:Uncharacterized protein n=1 Tax=Arundo donax TaxID=35708 RepID=A0A0A9G6B3_ARUDO